MKHWWPHQCLWVCCNRQVATQNTRRWWEKGKNVVVLKSEAAENTQSQRFKVHIKCIKLLSIKSTAIAVTILFQFFWGYNWAKTSFLGIFMLLISQASQQISSNDTENCQCKLIIKLVLSLCHKTSFTEMLWGKATGVIRGESFSWWLDSCHQQRVKP